MTFSANWASLHNLLKLTLHKKEGQKIDKVELYLKIKIHHGFTNLTGIVGGKNRKNCVDNICLAEIKIIIEKKIIRAFKTT